MLDKKKILCIDYLKAICIVIIVINHSRQWANANYGFTLLDDKNMYFASFCNGLFFIIPGYLCHKQDVKLFYKKRVRRILIPFVFFTSLKLIYSFIIDQNFFHVNIFTSQLYDAFIMGNLYWFSYALFLMNLVMPFLWVEEENRTIKKIPYRIIVVLIILLIINGLISFFHIENIMFLFPFQLYNFVMFFPFFLIGYLLKYINYFASNEIALKRIFLFAIGIVVSIFVIILKIHYTFSSYIITFIYSLSISYCLFCLSNMFKFNSNIINKVGENTYQIYLFEPLIRVILFSLLSKYINISILFIVIISIINVVICSILSFILSKNRYTRLFIGK